MRYLRTDRDFPCLVNTAVTLGKFDGVHRGHRRLIENVLGKKTAGAETVLFAFDLGKNVIFTGEERRDLLDSLGIDLLLECPLKERIRSMEAETFVKEILVSCLHVSSVTVGEDFRFGYQRKGSPELLLELGKTYGFQTDVIPKEMDHGRKISSTRIRQELEKGHMERARELLGTPFFLKGIVKHGSGIGHRELLPTINLIPPEEKLMPPGGVYFTKTFFSDRMFCGMTNVGYKPTVDGSFLGAETHLFDCDEDLYGRECRVEFLHYSRPEYRFTSISGLREQLAKDAAEGKEFFSEERKKQFT